MTTGTTLPQPPPALLSPAFFADPYPTYHALRAAEPVLWDETLRSWLLSGYAEVAAALSDLRLTRGRTAQEEAVILDQLTASGQGHLRPLRKLLWRMMLFSDPPAHTRLRALANRAFTPAAIERMRPRIQALVDTALDAVQAAGQMDVIADLANPLPVVVIGDMLSLPPDEREQFKRWSDDIIAFGARLGADQPGVAERALRSTHDLMDYFRALVAKLRRHPNDSLLSALVTAEEQGDRLTEEELLANAVLLLLGAANRDPARFTDPDRLDLGRRDTGHLDFGRGIHFCIGAALARTELQIAITTVLQRMPELRLISETVEWQTAPPIFRGLKALPVAF